MAQDLRKAREEQQQADKHGCGGASHEPTMLGRAMTPDEKVDEALRESMDGSDAPGYLSVSSGAPEGHTDDDEAVRKRAYELWEKDGRLSGRDVEYWQRAQAELHGKPKEDTR